MTNIAITKKNLIGKRSILFRKLFKIREILPGSLSQRHLQCGNRNCICRREGKRHTAFQYSFKLLGEKQVTRNIPKGYISQLEARLKANKEFSRIIRAIQEINLELLFLELEEFRARQKQEQKQK